MIKISNAKKLLAFIFTIILITFIKAIKTIKTMKKILLLLHLLLCVFTFSQEQEQVKLNGNIYDSHSTTKSLSVIDLRENKSLGVFPFGTKKEMKELVFLPNISENITTWFDRQTEKKGNRDLVLVIENLEINGDFANEKQTGETKLKAAMFLKKDDGYYFIHKINNSISEKGSDIPKSLGKKIPLLLSQIIIPSFDKKEWEEKLTLEQLKDYESILTKDLALNNNKPFKDGVYTSSKAFFKQNPENGNFVFEKNDKGMIVRAISIVDGKKTKIPTYKMYAFVEKGKAYKITYAGYEEIKKDEKGYYIFSNKGYLFPPETSGVGYQFGLIGGIAEAIAADSKEKKEQKKDKDNIYLDQLTGEYIF